MSTESVLAILQTAIAKEEERHGSYLEASQQVSNPLARRTFEFLAADELNHKQYIEAYYQVMQKEGHWPSVEECGEGCKLEAQDLQKLFDTARSDVTGAVTRDSELTEIYDLAMQAERESIQFYSEQLEKATVQEARAFYEVLLNAEHQHLQLLSETQMFLDDTTQWYIDEEQWTVEG